MFGLSFWEIGMILLVALVVLGPERLPRVARSLGRGLRQLRRASSDVRQAISGPLREVQEPLREIRDDLYDAVQRLEHEVDQELAAEATEQSQDSKKALEPAVPQEHAPADQDSANDDRT